MNQWRVTTELLNQGDHRLHRNAFTLPEKMLQTAELDTEMRVDPISWHEKSWTVVTRGGGFNLMSRTHSSTKGRRGSATKRRKTYHIVETHLQNSRLRLVHSIFVSRLTSLPHGVHCIDMKKTRRQPSSFVTYAACAKQKSLKTSEFIVLFLQQLCLIDYQSRYFPLHIRNERLLLNAN